MHVCKYCLYVFIMCVTMCLCMCPCTTVSLIILTSFRDSVSSVAQCPRNARLGSLRQRVLVFLCPFKHMSAGTIPSSPHGSAPNEDSSSEDAHLLEACDAFASSQLAGSLHGSGPEVVGAPRGETTAVLAATRRASPRRTLLASSSPRLSASPSSPHGARRSCKRDSAVSDASPAEH